MLVDVTFWTAVVRVMSTRHVHNKWYLVSVSYLVLLLAACSKERTAPHDTTPQNQGQGTAPHYAALHCWAIYNRADLSWGCVVIQQRSRYKLIGLLVPVRGMILRMNVTGMYELIKVPQSTQHGQSSKARQSTALRSAKLELQGIAGHCTALRCCEL